MWAPSLSSLTEVREEERGIRKKRRQMGTLMGKNIKRDEYVFQQEN